MGDRGDSGYDFTLNPKLRVSVRHVGSEGEPVMFAEDVLRDPGSLVRYAAGEVRFTPAWTDKGGYPGIRSHAPLAYVTNVVQGLAPVIQQTFALGDAFVERADCYLSLVTRRPEELTVLQRVPHIDTTDPLRIAVLHYLCDESFGGTAFYRHRSTDLATIDEAEEPRYLAARDRELDRDPPPPGFIAGDTPAYRQTARVEARFNRVLIYRSRHLHCGCIGSGMNYSSDPRKGRLTANVFINYTL